MRLGLILSLIYFISGGLVTGERARENATEIMRLTSSPYEQQMLIAIGWNESRLGIDSKGRYWGCGYQRTVRAQVGCAHGTMRRNLIRCNGSLLSALSRYNHGNGCEITSYGIRIYGYIHRMNAFLYPWTVRRNEGCVYRD